MKITKSLIAICLLTSVSAHAEGFTAASQTLTERGVTFQLKASQIRKAQGSGIANSDLAMLDADQISCANDQLKVVQRSLNANPSFRKNLEGAQVRIQLLDNSEGAFRDGQFTGAYSIDEDLNFSIPVVFHRLGAPRADGKKYDCPLNDDESLIKFQREFANSPQYHELVARVQKSVESLNRSPATESEGQASEKNHVVKDRPPVHAVLANDGKKVTSAQN